MNPACLSPCCFPVQINDNTAYQCRKGVANDLELCILSCRFRGPVVRFDKDRFMQANYRCAQARERHRSTTPTIGSKAGQLHAKLQRGPACRCVVTASRPRSSGAGYLVEGDSVARGRFVVADGDYSLELAMPDKMVDWDVIREVRGVAAVGHG